MFLDIYLKIIIKFNMQVVGDKDNIRFFFLKYFIDQWMRYIYEESN